MSDSGLRNTKKKDYRWQIITWKNELKVIDHKFVLVHVSVFVTFCCGPHHESWNN